MTANSSLPYFTYSIFLLAAFISAEAFVQDPDVLWHLASGKWMLANMEIPTENIFSFTANNYVWMNISWGWDLLFGAMDQYLGIYTPLAVTMLIASATIFILTRQAYIKSNSVIATSLVLLIGSAAFFPTLSLRPHMITYLLIPILIILIRNFVASDLTYKKALLIIPAIMLLWANMHGGFLVAYTILAAYLIELLVARDFTKFKQLATIVALCAIASLINPLGSAIYEAIYRTLGGELQNHINEWQPISNWYHYIYPVIFAGVLLVKIRKFSVAEILLGGFWLVMAFASVRYSAILFVITAPLMALGLQNLFSEKDKIYRVDLSGDKANRIGVNTAAILTAVVYLSQQAVLEADNAIVYLRDEAAGKNVLNHYNYGGEIIYHTSSKTFIDGRAETAFPDELIKDYINFDAKHDFTVLDRYEIDLVLYPQSELTDKLKTQGWNTVYENANRVILEK